MMTVTEMMAARDTEWRAAVAAGAEAMAAKRAEYVAAGWTICEHPTCSPTNCQPTEVVTEVKASALRIGQTIAAMPGCAGTPRVGPIKSVDVVGQTVKITHSQEGCGWSFHYLHAEQMVPLSGKARGKRKSAPELVFG
jgi:hypothetical protein